MTVRRVQVGVGGQVLDPERERGQRTRGRGDGFAGQRVADVADHRARARGGTAAAGRFAAGDPHVLRPDLSSASNWKSCSRAKCADLVGRDADAAPGVVLFRVRRQAVHLAAQDAAGFEHAPRLAQVAEDDVAAGNVLEDGVGVDEVELLVGKQREVGAGAVMRVRVGRVAQALAGQADHLVGDVHAVDLAEVAAERAHQAARAAADLERGIAAAEALQIARPGS